MREAKKHTSGEHLPLREAGDHLVVSLPPEVLHHLAGHHVGIQATIQGHTDDGAMTLLRLESKRVVLDSDTVVEVI